MTDGEEPGRQRVALAAPPDDLTGFPTSALAGEWYRAHTAQLAPWWFAHDGHGRFDLREPHGTCYLGSHVMVAVRERLGETLSRAGMISAIEADRMVVSRLPVEATAADATRQSATRYGVTRELGTVTPYQLPQRWAAALHAAGHAAIRYWARFSVGSLLYAAGLFGAAGADPARPGDPDPLGGRDAAAAAGVMVVGVPRSLATVQPPA